jgi:phosphorylase superfamily
MVLVLAGVGKVQASIATTLLVQNYSPELLINIGIAGSLL